MYNAKLESDNVFSVWGDGTPLREFLYVDDLSNAIKFVIENDINEDLLNIGFGEEISIKELALKIKKIVNFAGDIEFDKTKPNGNPRKLLNYPNTKLRMVFVFTCKGLKLSFNWFTKFKWCSHVGDSNLFSIRVFSASLISCCTINLNSKRGFNAS